MATSSKKAVKRSRPRRVKSKTNLTQYARLRTILDSLEIGALRYYLDAKSTSEREQRFERIQSALLPIIRQMWGRGEAIDGCPEGYMDCGGVCVPYQCVGSEF
jgi:hypothetical protein